MFKKIFGIRKNKSASTAAAASATRHSLTDRAAWKIVIAIHCLQTGFASFLNKKTKHFSSRTWKILIVVFGACWGLFSFYVASSALLRPAEKSAGSVRRPAPAFLTGAPKRSDSLQWMEKIYDERKTLMQLQFDTTDTK